MSLIFMWFGTIIASFGLKIANDLRKYKDAAESGYLINPKKLNEFAIKNDLNKKDNGLTLMLLPVINILTVFQQTEIYNKVRPMILSQLNVMDVLIEMTDDEKKAFAAKPTTFNAIKLTVLAETVRTSNIITLHFKEGGKESTISFTEDENKNRTVVKATGPIALLTVSKQLEIIEDALVNVAKSIDELISNIDSTVLQKDNSEEIFYDSTVLVDKDQIKANNYDKSASTNKEELEALKENLMALYKKQHSGNNGFSKIKK